jgi:hypothetical protein
VGAIEHLHLSPSRSPPDIRSALGLFPLVENTMQSMRCSNSGISTALNFCKSPGCRHGFLVTSTSVLMTVRGVPVPSSVIRTKHSSSSSLPERPFLLRVSHTPKRRRDRGIRIRHRCSSRLLSIFAYSCLTRPLSVGWTASTPSRSSFSASSRRLQYERN